MGALSSSKNPDVYSDIEGEDTEPCRASEEKRRKRMALLAYITTFVSMAVLSLGLAACQLLAGVVPDFELSVWRFSCQIILTVPMLVRGKHCDFRIPRESWPMMLGTFLSLFGTVLTFYAGPKYLPVGTFFGMYGGILLITNAVISICVKSERALSLYLSAGLSVLGIMLLVQPSFMFEGSGLYKAEQPLNRAAGTCMEIHATFDRMLTPQMAMYENVTMWMGDSTPNITGELENNGSKNSSEIMEYLAAKTGLHSDDIIGYSLVIASGISAAAWLHGCRILSETIAPELIALYIGIAGIVCSLLVMCIVEVPLPRVPSGICLLYLLMHSFGSSQNGIVFAMVLKHIPVMAASLIDTTSLVYLMFFQYTWLAGIRPGLGNWVEVLGACICLFSSVLGPTWHLITFRREEDDQSGKMDHPLFEVSPLRSRSH